MRIENGLWWKEEIPSPLEMANGAKALDENGKVCWSADFEDGRAAVYEKNGWKIIREGG